MILGGGFAAHHLILTHKSRNSHIWLQYYDNIKEIEKMKSVSS
jgi:hypothetical protein